MTLSENNPPAPKMPDLGTWSQYTTGNESGNSGSSKKPKSRAGRKITAVCPNCGKKFKTNNPRRKWCKPGCRTWYSRKKCQRVVTAVWEAYGVTESQAQDIIEKLGAAKVCDMVEKLGYRFDGEWWEKNDDATPNA